MAQTKNLTAVGLGCEWGNKYNIQKKTAKPETRFAENGLNKKCWLKYELGQSSVKRFEGRDQAWHVIHQFEALNKF